MKILNIKNKKNIKKRNQQNKFSLLYLPVNNRGFVILIASLLAGLLTIIGASIFSIFLKELILSSGGKESQLAFYAADGGVECALYWDSKEKFATSSDSESSPSNLFCNNQDITLSADWVWKVPAETTPTASRTIFSIDLYPSDPDRKDCAAISVFKDNGNTIIESRGYNTCDLTNPRRVERGLRVSY